MDLSDPGLQQAVADCDAIVRSTGAEEAGDLMPPEAARIEYRHIPEPGDVARLVLPHLAARTENSPSDKNREAS